MSASDAKDAGLPPGIGWFKASVTLGDGAVITIGPVAAPHAIDAALNLIIVAHRHQGAMSQKAGRDIAWPAAKMVIEPSDPPGQIQPAFSMPGARNFNGGGAG